MFGYLGLLAVAFAVMLIHTTFLTALFPALLTLPWSGWLGHYGQNDIEAFMASRSGRTGTAVLICMTAGGGLINAAVLWGVSRLFKKSS
jgi:hypothetical protein